MASLANITDNAQFSALADEHRRKILRLLMAKPATLTHLADALDSYPAQVRHHVKQLEKVGLVRLAREVTTRNYTEKFYEATAAAYTVHLMLVPDRGPEEPLVIVHCDEAIETLATMTEEKARSSAYSTVTIGSLDGLIALRQGLADIAGCHLLDPDSHEYNVPYVRHLFPGTPMVVVTLAHREQGLVVAPGNPKRLAQVADLAQDGVKMINREPGSGTRTWLDGKLTKLGISGSSIAGWESITRTHAGVASAIASGEADAGIAPRSAAVGAELDFVPLFSERYDLVFDQSRIDETRIQHLLNTLDTRSFKKRADGSQGYDTAHTGDTTVAL